MYPQPPLFTPLLPCLLRLYYHNVHILLFSFFFCAYTSFYFNLSRLLIPLYSPIHPILVTTTIRFMVSSTILNSPCQNLNSFNIQAQNEKGKILSTIIVDWNLLKATVDTWLFFWILDTWLLLGAVHPLLPSASFLSFPFFCIPSLAVLLYP
jgi:hypothetical protein